MNEIIADKKNINNQIFLDYFKYQNWSFLVKDLISSKWIKNGNENENLKKVVHIVEKTLDFNKQQRGKGVKILIPKQMFQRLPIALVQAKARDTSENLLNEIRQIIYFLYQEKKVTTI